MFSRRVAARNSKITSVRFSILYIIQFFLLAGTINAQRIVTDLNKQWQFSLAFGNTAIPPAYNFREWRTLDLPHDWSIEGEFSQKHPATTQGGALPGGIGWYRKTFEVPSTAKGKNVSIEFDGVYRNSEVWINGHHLGKRPNGYISFSYDLTPYIKQAPGENVIIVKVDNKEQPNSRWYTGSGIYRNVRLVYTNPKAAVAHDGVFITTSYDDVTGHAKVFIDARYNFAADTADVSVKASVYDKAGNPMPLPRRRPAGGTVEKGPPTSFVFETSNPHLWSVDDPYLYNAVVQVYIGKQMVDEYSTLFGIRHFNFDPQKGFFLNGESMKIKGVCLHHDLGALGAAVNKRAIERQLQILKAMGCNAIRTAHNPPAPELLDLCDRMGFLVMVEAFDMWRKKKNKYDYFSDFEEWHKRDLEDMVKRDRNHPSVFMWSIGNEIREQFDSTGITLTRELFDIVRSLDTTRPIIAGLSEWNPEKNFMYKSGVFDIVGLNYHHEIYKDFHKYYPGKIFLGAENMSALATRGHYDFPSDSMYFWPARSPQKYVENGNPDYTVSAYDQVAAYWGSTHEQTWKIIKKHDFMSGLFVWTGWDYLGEPTPYPWPARSSYFGIVDLAGFPKDIYYMYQSEWTNKPVLHIFPHWNWEPGKMIDIWAYYNNADEVELYLNGRSLGVKKKKGEDLHVMWRVPFTPGTIKAVSRKKGKVVLTKQISTAGAPAKIELKADRSVIKADGKDLSFVTVRILDKNGNLVPNADQLLHFTVEGTGTLAATDNGYQADTTSFKSTQRKTWKGLALAIIQSSGKKGNITLTVSAQGLPSAILTLKTND